jgi:hypothetical protein
MANAPLGTTSAAITVNATVNGDQVTLPLNLTLNRDTRKLLFSDVGVALSSMPGWSRLSHTVTVRDNYGQAPNWSASASQPWLNVVRQGNQLTLTANPASLPVNAVSYATVTLSSTDGSINTAEPLRVAVWKSSNSPGASFKVNRRYEKAVTDPIRPYVYATDRSSQIDVYNVYTGALVTSINANNTVFDMTVAPSGDVLYAGSHGGIIVIDLTTMTKTTSWQSADPISAIWNLSAIRPNGVNLVVADRGEAFLANSGTIVRLPHPFAPVAASTDGTRMYSYPRFGTYPPHSYSMDYSDILGGTILSAHLTPFTGTGVEIVDGSSDIAASADGNTVYMASSKTQCDIYRADDFSVVGVLSVGDSMRLARNVEVGSDGRVYCGIEMTAGSSVTAHTAQGTLLASFSFDSQPINSQLRVSGDGMMLIVPTGDGTLRFVPVGP